MKYLLIAVYAVLFIVCSLDLFQAADFMVTIFFASTACILCALIATKVDSLFAELFVMLQAVALVNYAALSISYSFFDSALFLLFENINSSLLITDIITLIGVMLGDRWLYNRVG
jgi:hypothetical protein